MNLYLRELRAHRKSLIIWAVCMSLLVFMGVAKYKAGVATGDNSINELMKDMPESLQNLMGTGVFDLSKLVDYFGVLYIYLALILTIHAVMTGNGIIAKEEKDKTSEFLLVKPISRKTIVTTKLLAGFSQVIIMNLVTWISTLMVFVQTSPEERYALAVFKIMLGLLGLQIAFFTIGAFLAALSGKYKLTSALSTGLLIIMFLLSVVIDMTGKIDFLRGFSLFKYFDSKEILKLGYNGFNAIGAILISAILVSATFYFYQKRDMKI